MAMTPLPNYLRYAYLIAIVNVSCLLLGLGHLKTPPEHTEQNTLALIFAIGEQQIKIWPEDIEEINIGIIHIIPTASLQITLTPQARQKIQTLTSANIGQRMQISWDGTILDEDIIEAPLGNEISITGLSPQTVEDFIQWLNQSKSDSGSLS